MLDLYHFILGHPNLHSQYFLAFHMVLDSLACRIKSTEVSKDVIDSPQNTQACVCCPIDKLGSLDQNKFPAMAWFAHTGIQV